MYQEHSNKCSGVKNSQRDPPGLHTLWAITENLITIAVVSHDLLDSHDNHGKRINIFKASITYYALYSNLNFPRNIYIKVCNVRVLP